MFELFQKLFATIQAHLQKDSGITLMLICEFLHFTANLFVLITSVLLGNKGKMLLHAAFVANDNQIDINQSTKPNNMEDTQ